MTILMIALLYVSLQPGFECGRGMPSAGHLVPLALTASSAESARTRLLAHRHGNLTPSAADQLAGSTKSNDADLLFYLDSHAKALSDNGAGSMNPWVDLHPFGAAEAIPDSGFSDSNIELQPVGHQEQGRLSGSGNACS